MKLLVTGASGFVGSHVVRAALRRGHSVNALVRPSSDRSLLAGVRARIVAGDVTEKASLRDAVNGIEAVVHCAAITSERAPDLAASRRTNVLGTENLLDLCREIGVRRFLLVSTQSAAAPDGSVYGTTKIEAEKRVIESGLAFTIVRPSTVYGPGARGLFAKIESYVRTLPVIPLVGDGSQRFRPIWVEDLAEAIVSSLGSNETIGRTYELGGRDGVSFAQFIDAVAEGVGRSRMKIRIPVPLCLVLARVLALVLAHPPLTVDNVIGMTRMSECDISRAEADFGFRPLSFREGMDRLKQRGRFS